MDPSSLIAIGRVTRRHGVRGELRVMAHNPSSVAIEKTSALVLRRPDGSCVERRVTAVRRHNRLFLMRVEGVETAEAAEEFVGGELCIAREALPALSANEYYHADLIGCAVRTQAGDPVGLVDEILSTGSNDVCVVRGEKGEYLIPLIEDAIAAIDVGGREIVLRALPGLLER